MPNLSELWEAIMYDSSPGERLRFARILYRIGIAAFTLWAIGLLTPVGLTGFARAQDVDTKIRAAVDPINKDLDTIKQKLDRNQAIQERILVAQISAQLRDLNRLRCSTKDAVLRARLEQDIEAQEQEYRSLVGERYPLPTCKEL